MGKLRCPINSAIVFDRDGGPKDTLLECWKEECMWYVHDTKLCAMHDIALTLADLLIFLKGE